MDDLKERAARLGIATEYWDALGRHRVADPEALERMVEALSAHGAGSQDAGERVSAAVTPVRAYQGGDEHRRSWALAVQLYGVRSRRNWGHGDFTDLANLIELAAAVGAAGIGLNPIHALFDESAEASPYSPNSRLFLNPRYIDVEAVPEFCGLQAAGLAAEVAALRRESLIDYAGVVAAKTRALRLSYGVFRARGHAPRRRAFERFRRARGTTLTRFAAFEHLRRKFARPWWDWPAQWQRPDDRAIERLRRDEADVGFYEYLQWLADAQLSHCVERGRAHALPIGLYLDVAVGVRADGFDGWSNQDCMLGAVEVGAPPDALNTAGQKWGLVGFNPVALEAQACEPFRNVLRASMRYAGAIRLDHVLGLRRLFLVPSGMTPVRGIYVRFPFEALLAATAQESLANKCIVVGEDLGTVPENFRETIARYGLWSYQVMAFERNWDIGTFRAPEEYKEQALATFATHDMPTFAGWASGHDLGVKRALGMDPGETDEARRAAQAALGYALFSRGLSLAEHSSLDYLSAMKYLAAVRSRLAVVTLEDVLGDIEQVNVPGTVDEHPNWRRRMAVDLEDLPADSTLGAVAEIMAAAGRRIEQALP
jgi:4-alpha-glucanotransferase